MTKPAANLMFSHMGLSVRDGPPDIACQIIVEFASLAEVDRMLASPERQALRARVREIAGMFDGAISHIDFEVARSQRPSADPRGAGGRHRASHR
ncbi:MAG: hypothetical protein JWR80_8932 [Bradyrhizobium sp.]|nr:hypothetical protein [Bradyrhizobium sp.]